MGPVTHHSPPKARTTLLRMGANFPGYFLRVGAASILGRWGSTLRERIREDSIAEITGRSATEVSRAWSEACSIPAFRDALARLDGYGYFGQFTAAKELFAIVRLLRPQTVVETGVGSGYSSLHVLEGLRRNGQGRLYSIDLPNADPTFKLAPGLSTGFLVPAELRSFWDLRLGPTSEHLVPLLAALGSVDLFLHDSGHDYNNMMFELTAVFPKMAKGGVLLIDDSNSNTAVLDFSKAINGTPIPLFDGLSIKPPVVHLILSIRKQ